MRIGGSSTNSRKVLGELKMKTIFIVDDNDTNKVAAKDALDNSYLTFALSSAERMFKLMERITPDLILLDIDMPEMDGFEAMKILSSDPKFKNIPVIFLTAKQDTESEIRGFELGAIDFISKPFSPPVLLKRVEVYLHFDHIIKKSQKAVRDAYEATIRVLANFLESRDKTTGGHVERTQIYLDILLRSMINLGIYSEEVLDWDLDLVVHSAQLHDIGKIGVSDVILNKPGKLSPEEYEKIKLHSILGEEVIAEIIKSSNDDLFLHHAKRFAGSHHEKWDGSGYPRGLSGESIPLEGRVLALVDVYDALVSHRPYKKPFTHEKAIEIINSESGKHFDPQIVKGFASVSDDFWAECEVLAARSIWSGGV